MREDNKTQIVLALIENSKTSSGCGTALKDIDEICKALKKIEDAMTYSEED